MLQAVLIVGILLCFVGAMVTAFLSSERARRIVADIVTHTLLVAHGAEKRAQRERLSAALISHAVLQRRSDKVSARKVAIISLVSSILFLSGLSSKLLLTLNPESVLAKYLGGGAFGGLSASLILLFVVWLSHFIYDYACILAHLRLWRWLKADSLWLRLGLMTMASIALTVAPFVVGFTSIYLISPNETLQPEKLPLSLLVALSALVFNGPTILSMGIVLFIISPMPIDSVERAVTSVTLIALSCFISYLVFVLVLAVDILMSHRFSARVLYYLAKRVPTLKAQGWFAALVVSLGALSALVGLLGITFPLEP